MPQKGSRRPAQFPVSRQIWSISAFFNSTASHTSPETGLVLPSVVEMVVLAKLQSPQLCSLWLAVLGDLPCCVHPGQLTEL